MGEVNMLNFFLTKMTWLRRPGRSPGAPLGPVLKHGRQQTDDKSPPPFPFRAFHRTRPPLLEEVIVGVKGREGHSVCTEVGVSPVPPGGVCELTAEWESVYHYQGPNPAYPPSSCPVLSAVGRRACLMQGAGSV